MLKDFYFYKDKDSDRIWLASKKEEEYGPFYFSFDRKRVFNFWQDYPSKLSNEEIDIFNEEFPELAKLKAFGGRKPKNPR